MFEILEDGFYTRADLQRLLEGTGVNADTFVARLRPRKVFRCHHRGADLLEAWDRAPALKDLKLLPQPKNRGGRRGRRASVQLITREEIGL